MAVPTVCPLPGNPLHGAPARNKLGNDGFGSNSPLFPQFDNYGTVTGTSMAAPIVTGTVGLVRSLNPLIRAADVTSLLAATGSNGAASIGAEKIVNADLAVQRTLGVVRGFQKQNRLIPMFSLCSRSGTKEMNCESSLTSRKWIFTSSPQIAQLSIAGRLFARAAMNTGNFGVPAASAGTFFPASNVGIGKPLTFRNGAVDEAWYSFPRFTTSESAASASFYLLAGPVSGESVKPLWHLISNCSTGPRRHRYSTLAESAINLLVGNGDGCNQTDLTGKQSRYVIEGYVYSNPGPDRVALYRSEENGLRDQVLALESELAHTAFSDRTFSLPIGYVVPAVTYSGSTPTLDDADGDGLVDRLERMIGTNELTVQSDCETNGMTDLQEYPLAAVQGAGIDPMTVPASFSCADIRFRAQKAVNAGSGLGTDVRVEMLNPAGPSHLGTTTMYVNIWFGPSGTATLVSVPSGCVPAPPRLAGYNYFCSASLAVGSTQAFQFQFSEVITASPVYGWVELEPLVPSAFTDPVPANNSVEINL